MCKNLSVVCVCVCACVRACVFAFVYVCKYVCVNIDLSILFVLTFPNMFFTFSLQHLTPSCLLIRPPAPTLPLGRRRRARGNFFCDDGTAALAGAVANLIALEKLNLG